MDGPEKVLRDTGCTGMIVDRALIPDSMVIPGSSGSLLIVDHTLIDVPLAFILIPHTTKDIAKPAQIKKNDNRATEGINVQEDTTEGKCVAGPVLTGVQAKSDKIHPLKVKEAMSSIDKTTIEDLQKKDFTLKNALTK